MVCWLPTYTILFSLRMQQLENVYVYLRAKCELPSVREAISFLPWDKSVASSLTYLILLTTEELQRQNYKIQFH